MVREIVKDKEILKQPCEKVEKGEDVLYIIQDLIDTAEIYKDKCIGLAANQIGYNKRIVLIKNGASWVHFINPVICENRKHGKCISEEGCLSLDGVRTVPRWNRVTLRYRDDKGDIKVLKDLRRPYSIVLQHEVDHLNGILI
ncbi:MAG: formylmethionine deformylase [Herbinix sp.]|jgi:peptide deformylase|nr:formylmethionine deformylase [Herbinix sp.]